MKVRRNLSCIAAACALIVLFCGGVQAATSYLDNGVIKLGVDLSKGGAISWLSQSGSSYSVVNTADRGRYVQQSYYSGPAPFSPPGVQKASQWASFPWNPVQAGDAFGYSSQVLASYNTGSEIYVKARPMQWALKNYPADCNIEQWITLNGTAATVHNRLTMLRSDTTYYGPYQQELPAVYPIADLDRLATYDGAHPFTYGAMDSISYTGGLDWTNFRATENWAAFVRSQTNWGLGVYTPGCVSFKGGLFGTPGGGTGSSDTGYIAPIQYEILDHNLVYDYSYDLILGNLNDIRNYIYAKRPDNRPNYVFNGDRQHWCYNNAVDTEVPTGDHLHVQLSASDPQMWGPACSFQAADVPKLYIRAAYAPGPADTGAFIWARDGGSVVGEQSVTFSVIRDGQYHTYALDLSSHPYWTGEISTLRFDPLERTAGSMDIQFISYIVPEPGSLVLLGIGLATATLFTRRRRFSR